jgi:glycine/D-amino acid oxidase-like deaminating enzyme
MTYSQTNIHRLPGRAESLWIATTPQTSFPSLQGNISVDVAIAGVGIAGITCAYLLKKAGLKVAIIEARKVLGGVTGYTTAKLTSLHKLIYDDLISKFGDKKAKQHADVNQAAIEKVSSLIKENSIDCDFQRKPAYTFAFTDQSIEKIKKEVQAAKSLGLPASYQNTLPMPFDVKAAIRFDNQAQFHNKW